MTEVPLGKAFKVKGEAKDVKGKMKGEVMVLVPLLLQVMFFLNSNREHIFWGAGPACESGKSLDTLRCDLEIDRSRCLFGVG